MRFALALMLAALLSNPAFATDPVEATGPPQPPQLLGVWYGEFTVQTATGPESAEMWMEISWQLSVDGWDVRGHKRWNVLDEPHENADGGAALGRDAERFDSVSGRIAADRKTVNLTEGHAKGQIEAALSAPDVLDATFHPHASGAPVHSVRLTRIDTHYTPTDTNVLGLDVSHHSGAVDWQRVKQQGYRFAYVKSSEGVDNPDAMFEEHWKGLSEAGLPRGAYHFYVTEDDPVEQAKFFASRLRDDPGTLPPAVDVELLGKGTEGDMTATLLTFLRTLEAELGIRPMIYTDSKFWNRYFRPELSAYPLWMAEYGVHMPKVPFGWKSWLFWQHSADRQVDGVEKTADISMVHPQVDIETLDSK
jgi:lysozyme